LVSEIRLYVEGGSEDAEVKARLRQGFSIFLNPIRELARKRRIRWRLIVCGSRTASLEAFQNDLPEYPDAFLALLVDAERPVAVIEQPWHHLQQSPDAWDRPVGAEDRHGHLMVQATEAWFLADREMLKKYFGKGYNEKALPKNKNIEQVPKNALFTALKKAGQKTAKRGYDKTRDAPRILEFVRLAIVRRNARACNRLAQILETEIGM
jgi:hypothetical protein